MNYPLYPGVDGLRGPLAATALISRTGVGERGLAEEGATHSTEPLTILLCTSRVADDSDDAPPVPSWDASVTSPRTHSTPTRFGACGTPTMTPTADGGAGGGVCGETF